MPICEGSCQEHIGTVKKVRVFGWGTFMYCDAAIEEDRRRGLTVDILEEASDVRRAISDKAACS